MHRDNSRSGCRFRGLRPAGVRTAPRRPLALFRLFYQVEIRHRQHPRSAIRAAAPASVSSTGMRAQQRCHLTDFGRPTFSNPPCESALTSARSHLFRVVCDQAQAWATPEAKSRTGSPGPESVRYDAIMAIAWCPIGDAKPAPEPADRKRVGRVAVVGAWPPVFDAAAVHAGPSCGADPGSAGARHRRSFRRALERGSATRHSARRRHCALNVVYRSRAHG